MPNKIRKKSKKTWNRFYAIPNVYWAITAKSNPRRGLVALDSSGMVQICSWDIPTNSISPLPNAPKSLINGVLSPDGRFVFFLNDTQGNEIGHYTRYNIEKKELHDLTPHMPLYALTHHNLNNSLSPTNKHFVFNVLDVSETTFYCVDFEADDSIGTPRIIFTSKNPINKYLFLNDGSTLLLCIYKNKKEKWTFLKTLNVKTGEIINEYHNPTFHSTIPIAFSPNSDDYHLLTSTSDGPFLKHFIWDLKSGIQRELRCSTVSGNLIPLSWSPDGNSILMMQYEMARTQLYTYNLSDDTLNKLHHPQGTISDDLHSTGNDRAYYGYNGTIYARWENATHPPQILTLNPQTGEKIETLFGEQTLPSCYKVESITFQSSDGQEIQGWLGKPKGAGPFPTILETHGGPFTVEVDKFSPKIQSWIDSGFAYCTINYRGSTHFGKEFEEKIKGNIGKWELEDMKAARTWLIDNCVAQKDKIILMGHSYGGFLTLFGLGKTPDLWAGGIAMAAVADWVLTYEDETDPMKEYQKSVFHGGPEDALKLYRASSPTTYVENITKPLFVIQGRNDSRTPPRQLEVFEKKMKAYNKFIEIHWYDTGHIFTTNDVKEAIKLQEQKIQFALRIINGTW